MCVYLCVWWWGKWFLLYSICIFTWFFLENTLQLLLLLPLLLLPLLLMNYIKSSSLVKFTVPLRFYHEVCSIIIHYNILWYICVCLLLLLFLGRTQINTPNWDHHGLPSSHSLDLRPPPLLHLIDPPGPHPIAPPVFHCPLPSWAHILASPP